MKKFAIALIAVSTLAAAAPAMAQHPNRPGYHPGAAQGQFVRGDDLRARYDRLADRITQGQRRGGLSYREADRLTQQLRALRQLDRQYRASGRGLTRSEYNDLSNRADRIQRQIRLERRDGDGRRR